MAATPLRQPCQATHTLPLASVVATGSISAPASFEILHLILWPGGIDSARKDIKIAPTFSDQKTHARPFPSTATAVL